MTLKEWIELNNVSMEWTFVPYSEVKKEGDKLPSLNYKIKLMIDGRLVLVTPYMMGCAHAPCWRPGMLRSMTMYEKEALDYECENGRKYREGMFRIGGEPIPPKIEDVLACLAVDAEAINYGSFEEYAEMFCENSDSIAALRTYEVCRDTGLKLRANLPGNQFDALLEISRDL